MLVKTGFPHEVVVLSAHRDTAALLNYVREAERRGTALFIAVAGLSAALPGVLSGATDKPVIAVPRVVGALGGIDALLSSVQTPRGVPVACVTLSEGAAGPVNAVALALRVLSLRSERARAAHLRLKESSWR